MTLPFSFQYVYYKSLHAKSDEQLVFTDVI